MGWFDKKSWQLRRKIRDLQSELAVAEREGKYVVAQGLFFAELQEMGDATMMVLGKADTFDTEEEVVIKNFFERNGFSVEALRLDKTHKTLALVEIIPPEEFTRRVAKALKEKGFRLIDDSDRERAASIENKTITLSSLIRTISALFASHVHNLIVTTPIKMNMEGNRLLHWMPPIRDALLSRVPGEVVTECREPFVDAYNHYYGRFGRMESIDGLSVISGSTDELADISGDSLETEFSDSGSAGAAPWENTPTETVTRDLPPETEANTGAVNRPAYGAPVPLDSGRALEAAHLMAKMYKSLIGATEQRKARNAEILLDYITRFFEAKSACVLGRTGNDEKLALLANSSTAPCLQTNDEHTVTCETVIVDDSLDRRVVVVAPPTNGNANPTAVSAPLSLDSHAEAVLYIVEPTDFHEGDAMHLAHFAQVFREFPDLLIHIPMAKS